jgi:uncharacterized protein with NRDE domain
MGDDSPESYLNSLRKDAGRYNGFNLLIGGKDELFWYSNRGNSLRKLTPGIYGLSNHLLDTTWPKVIKGKAEFAKLVSESTAPDPDVFFKMLDNRAQAPDSELPNTGVSIERERMLSSMFITSPDYGTRSSTLLFISNNDLITFIERSFNGNPAGPSTVRYDFVSGE